MPATIDLEQLGLDTGGHLLLERALAPLRPGDSLTVLGTHPQLSLHLGSWARGRGHGYVEGAPPKLIRGAAVDLRWADAERAGEALGPPSARADSRWGLAARGALVEAGGPPLTLDLVERDLLWADVAPQLYRAAAAAQWDPATAVDWTAGPSVKVPQDIETAVVQVMTYLVENEQAALIIPARLLSRVHPHFREVMQLLAVQAADEARHIEVFSRRALLNGQSMGTSGAGGRASLQSLLDEPDFTLAAFLLSVLGEGSFLDLLRFLHVHAPDPVTADVTRLAVTDEARHVAFGVAHTEHAARADPAFLGRLRAAVERRHAALMDTAGLNDQVYDSLVLLAAGSWRPADIANGWAAVQALQHAMDQGRQRRLQHIGFPADEAAALSALHSRNFM